MKMFHLPSTLCLLALGAFVGHAAGTPAISLPRSTPEAQGIASSAVLGFIEAADQKLDAIHSFMLVRHGHVITEGWWTPYDAQTPHELYSLSKSFTSTAVGLAIGEGQIHLDDTVISFFPDDVPADASANLKAMRIRDLLCMSAGHQAESPSGADRVTARTFLAQPVPFKPGTHFLYNTPATFMLSAIVQKATGQTVRDYLQPRLFEPLGIAQPTWAANAQGISLGGYGLSVRTEDIAKFGQLLLHKGKWNGRQLVPAAWVEAATSRQTSNGSSPDSDWDQGYGYQFWRCRHGAYRGDGAFGQYCIVLPEQDAVIAITSGLGDMQAVLNLVWDKLVPAMQPRRLAANASGDQQLTDKLAHLSVRLPAGAATSPKSAEILGRKFVVPANEQKLEALALEASPGGGFTLVRWIGGVPQRIVCGEGRWIRGRASVAAALSPQAIAAAGAWTAPDTFTAKLCLYETPYAITVTLKFAGNDVVHDAASNVGFGPTRQSQLVGHAE